MAPARSARDDGASPLPSLQGEGWPKAEVGSLTCSVQGNYRPHPWPLPLKGGERLAHRDNWQLIIDNS
jgi:hypothetical protein